MCCLGHQPPTFWLQVFDNIQFGHVLVPLRGFGVLLHHVYVYTQRHSLVQVFPDNACRREILSLEAYCTFMTSGCTWTGPLKELEVHVCTMYYVSAAVLSSAPMDRLVEVSPLPPPPKNNV